MMRGHRDTGVPVTLRRPLIVSICLCIKAVNSSFVFDCPSFSVTHGILRYSMKWAKSSKSSATSCNYVCPHTLTDLKILTHAWVGIKRSIRSKGQQTQHSIKKTLERPLHLFLLLLLTRARVS